MVLRAAEGLHALAVRGAGLVDVLGDRGGADERHRLDLGVGQQRVDGLLVTVHDAEHAVGQAGLLPQRGDGVDGRRVLLAGLDDDRVAAGDRDRHEPQRHHGREVERADDGDDAQALADRVDVDLGRGVLGEAALHQVRDAAGELGDLEATGHLAEGVGEDLAVLGGDQRGDVLLALVEQLAELEEHLGALGERDAAPLRGPGRVGGGDDLVDEVGRGEVELAALHPGGRVEDGAGALGGALPRSAVDQVGDAGRGRAHGVSVLVRVVGAFSVSEARMPVECVVATRFGHGIGRCPRSLPAAAVDCDGHLASGGTSCSVNVSTY